MATATDLRLIRSSEITKYIRLTLLNTNFVSLGEIQGNAISFSVTISANSDFRRTASLTVYVPDKSYLAEQGEAVWLDRIVRAEIGLFDDANDSIVWYNMGSYLMQENSYEFSATTQQLSMNLIDLMGAITPELGSQIGGAGMMIPYGSNARNAMISTVAQFSPFKRYDADELPDVIPYDLEFDIGAYPHDILLTILNLFPHMQMYYDVDGKFTVKPIPTGLNTPVELDETVMDSLILADGESRQNSLSTIKNVTEVWGKSLNAGYTAESCSTVGSTYLLMIDEEFEALELNSTYLFVTDSASVSTQKVKIQDLPAYRIYVQLGNGSERALVAGEMEADVAYVVKYANEKFFLVGEAEIRAICMEVASEPSSAKKAQDKIDNNCRTIQYVVNPNSPYSVERIGERRQVFQGGEYADIYTAQLAKERAAYENWKTTRLQDTVSLRCTLIPFLDVNKKISYTSPLTGTVKQYLVQEIEMNLDDFSTTLTLMQFFPVNPW